MEANVWGTWGSDSSWKPPSLAAPACNYFHILQLAEGTLSTQDPSSIVTLTFRISKQVFPLDDGRRAGGLCIVCSANILALWLSVVVCWYVCMWGGGQRPPRFLQDLGSIRGRQGKWPDLTLTRSASYLLLTSTLRAPVCKYVIYLN